jgi:hypothetical protein
VTSPSAVQISESEWQYPWIKSPESGTSEEARLEMDQLDADIDGFLGPKDLA